MKESNGVLPLATAILLMIVAGTPLAAYVWETLNRLLSGHVEPMRLLLSVPCLVLLYLLLRLTARRVPAIDRVHSAPRERRPA